MAALSGHSCLVYRVEVKGCLAVATGTILRPAGHDVRIVTIRQRTLTRTTGVAARPIRGVGDSKKREGTKYITIQVEVDGKHRVVFTGSEVLYNQLIKYQEHLPFIAIIRKINDFYSFT